MAFEPPVAVFDACILYPFHVRNIVVQTAVDRLGGARWTDEIHDEWIRNLSAHRPAVPVERLHKIRDLMNAVLPNATVTGYRKHLSTLSLPDLDDRHVVAAALESGASLVITWNLRDFPVATLARRGLRRLTPDAFLVDLYEQVPDLTLASLANARRNLNQTRVSTLDFVEIARANKLTRLAFIIAGHLADL